MKLALKKVPKYYKERYQSRNWFSVIFWLFVGFYLIANAWWVYIGWVMTNALDVATALFPDRLYLGRDCDTLYRTVCPKARAGNSIDDEKDEYRTKFLKSKDLKKT